MDIEQLNLNDSILIDITITNGEVVLMLDYIEDYKAPVDKWKTSIRLLSFQNCTELKIAMHPLVNTFGSILLGMQEKIDNNAYKFSIETNTSCCTINIMASSFLLSEPIEGVPCCPCPPVSLSTG